MNQYAELFSSTFIAVFLEASPFLVLGALLSTLVEIYLPDDFIGKYLPRGRLLGLLVGLSAGLLIPTCECGVLSVVRRLLKKGASPLMAITYMLSSPVINPLGLASTYIAFQGNIWMVLGRVFIVVVCAGCVGLIISCSSAVPLLRDEDVSLSQCAPLPSGHTCGDGHSQLNACFPAPGVCHSDENSSRLITVFTHTASEFLDMGKYLILGAFAVALTKVFMPREVLFLFQNNIFLGVGAMMLLAVLVSVCSEADAFVAASFVTLPAAAKLAFLAIGPMVDLKLIIMYSAFFNKRIALVLIFLPTVLVYLLSTILGVVIG
jgi:uncharacterized membrane protein YraQ (UPF0718 family)